MAESATILIPDISGFTDFVTRMTCPQEWYHILC